MTNGKRNSKEEHVNPIDWFLNQTQEDEISKQESVQQDIFEVSADDIAHPPHNTSQERSLDDTHETLTLVLLKTDALDEAVEDALKEKE